MSRGPLADLRVLDISPFLPGPFGTQMLADLGAVVIKVEPPSGDPARSVPGGLYETANRNKRGIVLDLKSPTGTAHCQALAAGADVFVEGFRPGAASRLGVAYEDLRPLNPGLIYCSLSGFGQTGPKRLEPGHDATYLAAAGVLSFPGSWADERPRRSGLPMADLAASGYLVVAVLASLRERDRTGLGGHLDVAIADAALALASVRAGAALDNATADRLHLNPTNDLFDTADGVIAVGVVEEHFWHRLRDALIEDEPALGDTRFDDLARRRQNGDELATMLRSVFLRRSTEEWRWRLVQADVPVEPVRTVSEAAQTEQTLSRGLVQSSAHDRSHVMFPVLRDGAGMGRLRRPAPSPGADTAVIIRALDEGADPWRNAEEAQ